MATVSPASSSLKSFPPSTRPLRQASQKGELPLVRKISRFLPAVDLGVSAVDDAVPFSPSLPPVTLASPPQPTSKNDKPSRLARVMYRSMRGLRREWRWPRGNPRQSSGRLRSRGGERLARALFGGS